MTDSHLKVLKKIVEELNSEGRDLVVCDDHDDRDFIVLRIKERGPRRFYGLFRGKPERILYEIPTISEGRWGMSRDPEITEALKREYGDFFYIDLLR